MPRVLSLEQWNTLGWWDNQLESEATEVQWVEYPTGEKSWHEAAGHDVKQWRHNESAALLNGFYDSLLEELGSHWA